MTKAILTFLFIISSSWGQSPKKLRFGTFLIPRYVKSTTEGDFIRLISALALKSKVEVEIVIFPPKRAYKELDEGNIDGFFPAMESRGLNAYETITNFYVKETFIYERLGHDYKKIKDAKVCTTEGYTYPEEYIKNQKWKRVITDSDETCLKLLSKKRVDLFIGENITANASVKSLGLEGIIIYNKYSPIASDNATLAFKKGKNGKEMSEKFDKALKEIIMDRSYDNIFSTGAVNVE